MHCADCHFQQDSHGTGILYNEPRAAVEIGCVDCHGTIKAQGKRHHQRFRRLAGTEQNEIDAARKGQKAAHRPRPDTLAISLAGRQTADPCLRSLTKDETQRMQTGSDVQLKKGDVVQNSIVEPDHWWRVKQTIDTVTPGNRRLQSTHRPTPRRCKRTTRRGAMRRVGEDKLAHRDSNMTCYACHTSWVTSCFGCHLSMEANRKMPNRHNEGGDSRNFTSV